MVVNITVMLVMVTCTLCVHMGYGSVGMMSMYYGMVL